MITSVLSPLQGLPETPHQHSKYTHTHSKIQFQKQQTLTEHTGIVGTEQYTAIIIMTHGK